MKYSRIFFAVLVGLSPVTMLKTYAGAPEEKNPVMAPVGISPTASEWEVTLNLYGWLSGVDAQMAVNGFQASTSFGIDDILRNLDMTAMFNLEVRRGRWGGWVDGLYLKVSSDADTPGRLLDSMGVSIESVIAEAALYYRVVEGSKGFVDLYGGARYMQMGSDLSLNVSDNGITEVSEELSGKVFDAIGKAIRTRTKPELKEAETEIGKAAQAVLVEQISARATGVETALNQLRQIASAHPNLRRAIARDGTLRRAVILAAQARIESGEAEAEEVAAAAQAASEKVRQAASNARSRAQKAVTRAEKKLAQAIESELRKAIPSEISATASWVDPFVGLRARYQLTDRIYALAKSDIGGFGVGSELVWQAYGGVGYQFNRHVATELGYKHFSLDYSGSRDLQADMQMSGVLLSLLIRF
jgi:hypothetical protein